MDAKKQSKFKRVHCNANAPANPAKLILRVATPVGVFLRAIVSALRTAISNLKLSMTTLLISVGRLTEPVRFAGAAAVVIVAAFIIAAASATAGSPPVSYSSGGNTSAAPDTNTGTLDSVAFTARAGTDQKAASQATAYSATLLMERPTDTPVIGYLQAGQLSMSAGADPIEHELIASTIQNGFSGIGLSIKKTVPLIQDISTQQSGDIDANGDIAANGGIAAAVNTGDAGGFMSVEDNMPTAVLAHSTRNPDHAALLPESGDAPDVISGDSFEAYPPAEGNPPAVTNPPVEVNPPADIYPPVEANPPIDTYPSAGEYPAIESAGAYIWPTTGHLTSLFGPRSATVGSTFHKGIDICGSYGQSICAANSGEVIVSGWSNSYGYVIQIEHDNGEITLYCHCSSLLVSVGDRVSQGQEIARMGNTGLATGTHLHFEVIIDGENVDPLQHLPQNMEDWGVWQ